MELILLSLLRILVPLLILKWPIVGIVASIYIDSSDWHLYPFRTEDDYIRYQIWDKVLDSYYLGIALYTALFWKDFKARSLAVFLFVYRFLGVLLFAVSQNNLFLFIFPNIFENLFIFYLVYKLVTKRDELFLPYENISFFLLVISIPKIFQEYLLHFADITATELFGIGNGPSFWLLFSIIFSLYLAILWWRINLNKARKIGYT